VSASADALRRDFDRSFAEPLRARSSGDVELLAVRVGGEPYLLPLRELAGLVADARMVGVPTPLAEFLGVIGIRGVVVPVYDLGAILRQGSAERTSWIALAARGRIGLAFDAFDGQQRVPSGELHPASNDSASRACVRGAVQLGETLVSIVDVPAVVDAIERRVREATRREEP